MLYQKLELHKMPKTNKLFTKDALVSMQVIDSKGQLMGKVTDIALEVGKNRISLAIQKTAWKTKSFNGATFKQPQTS